MARALTRLAQPHWIEYMAALVPARRSLLSSIVRAPGDIIGGVVGALRWAWGVAAGALRVARRVYSWATSWLPPWAKILADVAVGWLAWHYLVPGPLKRALWSWVRTAAVRWGTIVTVPAGIGGAVGMATGTGMLRGAWAGWWSAFRWPLSLF